MKNLQKTVKTQMEQQIEQFANENVLEEQLANKISHLEIPDFKSIANDPE